MSLKLTILGCGAAIPVNGTFPTAQYLQISNHHFLIDCGEGTQLQLRKYKVAFSSINRIFISHLHGDHLFGLIGLISSFQLLGRNKDLHLYGPKGIEEFIENQLKLTESYKNFNLIYHSLSSSSSELIFEDNRITVETIPLAHRIYCNGYLFKEKTKKRKINLQAVLKYPEIEKCDYRHLKDGQDYPLKTGEILPNALLTFPPPPSYSYAFCSDTGYHPAIIPLIQKVDLLYHEATFLENHKVLAQKTGHSTAKQASQIAKEAQVSKLILGHFSNRYTDKENFKKEAQEIFEPVELAAEGKVFTKVPTNSQA